jgi:hypothetical protein
MPSITVTTSPGMRLVRRKTTREMPIKTGMAASIRPRM